MNDTLHVLQLNSVPILQQLQIEEALLRVDKRNWCLINHNACPAIVMGISGKPHELINQDKMQAAPVPLIRRFSGGGTVFIDQDTYLITFICNVDSVPIHPFPEHIMRWTEKIYCPLFGAHPFALRENDYVIGERKCGGNAQSITKQRWLHHSSLLWDYKNAHMDYLLLPKKRPNYRQERPHNDFLYALKEVWPAKTAFLEQLRTHLEQQFRIKEVKEEEIEALVHLPHRRATMLIEE
jgi:lipoate-protein ligase A